MRRADWEQCLADYLGGMRGAVFSWGQCDCALFAAGAVAAMTGTDPAAGVRGRYKSSRGAARVLHRDGAASLADWVGARFQPIGTGFARRGDLVMAGGSLGICLGREAVFVGAEDAREGLVRLPLREWEHAWRVPFAEG